MPSELHEMSIPFEFIRHGLAVLNHASGQYSISQKLVDAFLSNIHTINTKISQILQLREIKTAGVYHFRTLATNTTRALQSNTFELPKIT